MIGLQFSQKMWMLFDGVQAFPSAKDVTDYVPDVGYYLPRKVYAAWWNQYLAVPCGYGDIGIGVAMVLCFNVFLCFGFFGLFIHNLERVRRGETLSGILTMGLLNLCVLTSGLNFVSLVQGAACGLITYEIWKLKRAKREAMGAVVEKTRDPKQFRALLQIVMDDYEFDENLHKPGAVCYFFALLSMVAAVLLDQIGPQIATQQREAELNNLMSRGKTPFTVAILAALPFNIASGFLSLAITTLYDWKIERKNVGKNRTPEQRGLGARQRAREGRMANRRGLRDFMQEEPVASEVSTRDATSDAPGPDALQNGEKVSTSGGESSEVVPAGAKTEVMPREKKVAKDAGTVRKRL